MPDPRGSGGGASQAAIEHHYDLPVAFFRPWLGPSLTYSSGYWGDGVSTLDQAQQAKLDRVLDLAGVRPGTRLLDVGCGWGSALRRAHERGVAEANGLTLSRSQVEHVNRWAPEGVGARLESWRDHAPADRYDSIVSIGAFEHFAAAGSPSRHKVRIYREFFGTCRDLLRRGTRLGLQSIVTGEARLSRDDLRDLWFVWREVFPESALPTIAEIAAAVRGLFEIRLLENRREDYVKTLTAWATAFDAHRAELTAVCGEDVADRYRRYLDIARRMFENGQTGLVRLSLARVD